MWRAFIRLALQSNSGARKREKKSVTKPLLKGVGGIKLSPEAWFSGVVIPVAFALVADIYLPFTCPPLPSVTPTHLIFFRSGEYVFFSPPHSSPAVVKS